MTTELVEQEFTDQDWDGSASRFSVEQLRRAVPDAVEQWALDRAEEEGNDQPVKADLKLPYREPDGTININGIQAALAALGGARGGVDLPQDVQSDARDELERWQDRAAEALDMDEATEESFTEGYEAGFAIDEQSSVDRGDNLVRNVRLLGRSSRNGRTYTESAVEDGVSQYPGKPIFLDHPTARELRERKGNRSVSDLAGKIQSARKTQDGVRGDIQVLEGNDAGQFLFAVAEQMPDIVGMSHRASGKVNRQDEGPDVVESIEDVKAVELVTDPATTEGLFESVEMSDEAESDENEDEETEESLQDEELDMKLDDLTEEQLRESRPDLVESIGGDDSVSKAELEKENDRLKTKLAERDHQDMVEEALAEADLPDRVVTEKFRESLNRADGEDEVDDLIEDRQELVEELRGEGGDGPTSREHDPDSDTFSESDAEEVTGDDAASFVEQAGL